MWLAQTSPVERRTLFAGFLGYGVDGFDFMVYTFVIPTLLVAWGMTRAQAGTIATGALLTSAIGGWAAGVLADRFGRVRLLQITVLWFAVFTGLSGFARSFEELLVTRALQGLGFGGEWSVGSVLVAETIAARHRGKAAGLVQSSWAVGWACAACAFWIVAALAPAAQAWRILFWLGILPALSLLYIRKHVVESPTHTAARQHSNAHFLDIFAPPLLGTTMWASLLCTGMLGAYYSVTTWLPTYLKVERHLSVTDTSAYLLVLIAGSFAGYLASGWASDALGRRRAFVVFAVCAAVLVVTYTQVSVTHDAMLILGFPLGFFLSGIFSGAGAHLSELYPSAVRGSGQGFCYNIGRAISAWCPALIGSLSERATLGGAIGLFATAAYGLVVVAACRLPETRGRVL